MIDFNKPMVASRVINGVCSDHDLAVQFLGTYTLTFSGVVAVVLIGYPGSQSLARVTTSGRARDALGEEYEVRNAPKVERISKFYTIEAGRLLVYDDLVPTPESRKIGKFVFVLTDGKVTAIELVK